MEFTNKQETEQEKPVQSYPLFLTFSESRLRYTKSDSLFIYRRARILISKEKVCKAKKIEWSSSRSSHQNLKYSLCYAMLCYAKSLQSCPTLCDPIDGSHQAPPSLGFSRQEHWSGLPIPSPMHESEKWKRSRSLLATAWTAAYQAPPSMGFSRQEYWRGVPLPSPKILTRCPIINSKKPNVPGVK